jgi:hypothetical protein
VRSHPKPEELEGLVRGTLDRARAKSVVRHFLRGCESCQAGMAPEVEAILGGGDHPPGGVIAEAAYDHAIERALAGALRHDRHLKREDAKIREALDRLAKDGVEGFQHFPMRLWGLAGYKALLERSWELRHDDPAQMVALAQLAALAASRLSVARYGARQIKDFECRATIELANAYRVANRLEEAQSTLDRAAALFLDGTEDKLLRAHFTDIQANIYGDRRQFAAAFRALDTSYRMYKREGAENLAAQALIVKGLYTGYANDPERAISLLRQGLASCDAERNPHLARAAVHNIAYFSVDSGRLREARRLIWQHRHLFDGAGRQEILKLRWLEGLIYAGLDELERAERILIEVREGFLAAGVPFTAAILSLNLASVWMSQGKEEQARRIVLEAARVFLDLKIGREAMAAVLLLRTAFEFRMATGALLAQVAQFLRNEKEPPMPSLAPS